MGTVTREFRLPDVGEGLTEAEIVTWRVAPGDRVEVNDPIVEIETAKSLVELPSPFAGVVEQLLVPAGETVPVGTAIITVAEPGGETVHDREPDTAAGVGAGEGGGRGAGEGGGRGTGEDRGTGGDRQEPVLVGYGPRNGTGVRSRRRPVAAPEHQPVAIVHPAAHPAPAKAPVPGVPVPGVPVPDVPAADVPDAAPVPPTPTHAPPAALLPTPAPPRRGRPAPPAGAPASRPLSTPPVRKLARDLGVDLRAVTPTGRGGVVTRADVEAAAAAPVAEPVPESLPEGVPESLAEPLASAEPAGQDETRIPVRGVRRATAKAMVASAFTAPHVTLWLSVDVTRSMKLVRRLKAERDFADVTVSPLLLAARAVLLGIRRHPGVNARWDEGAGEIVQPRHVNLGFAVASPRGLLVPSIKNADRLALPELAGALTSLVATTREGRATPADLTGGTFTITNIGVFGIDGGTPILNPGEAAILGLGQVRERPWVHRGRVRPRSVVELVLSVDHRIVDGELGGRFLADVGAVLERPERALVWA